MQATKSQRFGDYYLTAHIGRGGMADVYRARYVGAAGFQRTVVIKRILNLGDPECIRMFVNEAKLAAELTHPNIAHIYELGEIDGEFFIAMEYVRGKDLGNLLSLMASRKTPIPPIVAAFVTREVCRALAHAHAHVDQNGNPSAIIHRDVSPGNIVIGYDGQVKLVDFGVAKALHSDNAHTQAGIIKGKLGYMAPEQMEGLAIPQSDLFATGIVFHEMLTLRRLIKGESSFETMTKLKTMAFQPPSKSSPGIPVALDAIVLKSLDRDLDVRYATAAAMAKDLDLFVQSAGFSVEDLGQFMSEVYPTETQTDPAHFMPSTHSVVVPTHHIGTQVSRSNVVPHPVTGMGELSFSISVPRPLVTRRRVLLGASVLLGLATLGGYTAYRLQARGDSAVASERPVAAAASAAAASAATLGAATVAPLAVRGVTDTEVVFGISAAMTGQGKEYGHQMKVGIEAAFQVANEAGGVHGRRLRLVAVDDGYEPTRTIAAMKDLYEHHNVFGVVGNTGTPTAAVAVPFALEHKMLFFGAFSGASLLRRDPPDRYVFNFRASYVEETAAIVKYLIRVRHIRPEHIAVFAQNDAFGETGYASIAKAMRGLRPDVTSLFRMSYMRNTVDIEEAVAQLRERPIPIQAVVMLAVYRPAAKFIEQVRNLNRGTMFITGSWAGSAGLADELKMIGPRYSTGVVVTQVVPSAESSSTAILDFQAAMAKYMPEDRAECTALEAYLMSNLLIEGLRRVGPKLDTERLVNALEKIRDFDLGIGAPITLGSNEHQGSHKVWGTRLDEAAHYQPLDLE